MRIVDVFVLAVTTSVQSGSEGYVCSPGVNDMLMQLRPRAARSELVDLAHLVLGGVQLPLSPLDQLLNDLSRCSNCWMAAGLRSVHGWPELTASLLPVVTSALESVAQEIHACAPYATSVVETRSFQDVFLGPDSTGYQSPWRLAGRRLEADRALDRTPAGAGAAAGSRSRQPLASGVPVNGQILRPDNRHPLPLRALSQRGSVALSGHAIPDPILEPLWEVRSSESHYDDGRGEGGEEQDEVEHSGAGLADARVVVPCEEADPCVQETFYADVEALGRICNALGRTAGQVVREGRLQLEGVLLFVPLEDIVEEECEVAAAMAYEAAAANCQSCLRGL